MPICFMPRYSRGTDDQVDKLSSQEWREPPGYLGEAVRRAKRISELNREKKPEPEAH